MAGIAMDASFECDKKKFLRGWFLVWLGVIGALVFLDATLNYSRVTEIPNIRRLFNLTREDCLGNWIASVQLFVTAAIACVVRSCVRTRGAKGTAGWTALSAIFAYLAVDDGTKIHERVGTAFENAWQLQNVTAADAASYFPSYAWQLIFDPIFAAMGAFMLIFLWSELGARTGRFLLAAALSCFAVAVGLDFVEGLNRGYETVAAWSGLSVRASYHFGMVLEEALEMLGATFFQVCFLSHLTRSFPSVSVKWLENRGQ